jgi:hypothetical protein
VSGRKITPAAAIVAALIAGTSPSLAADPPPQDARVLGSFTMLARVTTAVNVRGEHAGQLLRRSWTITPRDCEASVCGQLLLVRQRSGGLHQRVTLRRAAPGRYTGSGAFWVALRCLGRVHRLGSRVPFRITLTVTAAQQVEDVAFARRIAATYVNPRRTDTTRCPLGPSHDAARYTGTATSALPPPPVAQFTDQVDAATQAASFTDTSAPASGGAQITSQLWNFGDPASGAQDTSTERNPAHRFTAPGSYQVALTVTDGNGLTATTAQTVTVPPSLAPSPARRRAR